MTGPMVFRGKEMSMLWLGISGVWIGKGLVGITPKLHKQIEKNNPIEKKCGDDAEGVSHFDSVLLKPVLVKLDGEVGHVLKCLVSEGHVHVHVALAPRERS